MLLSFGHTLAGAAVRPAVLAVACEAERIGASGNHETKYNLFGSMGQDRGARNSWPIHW